MSIKPVSMKRLVLFPVVVWLAGVCGFDLSAATFNVSPSVVSNTYAGVITLTVTGLTNTETVVIQKFLDANTNGVVDAADLLVQQFNLKEGTNFVIGGVTNLAVPGDLDAVGTQITAKLNLKNGDFIQSIIGKYLFKLSSPVGHFGPITNLFSITNFPYLQKITGNVVNNATNVPNAIVLLFPPPDPDHGPGSPVAGAIANNSGVYSVMAPAGNYTPVAFKSGFISSFQSPPILALGGGATVNTNLTFDAATQSISGRIVDAANNSIGLPGLFLPVQANGLIAIAFTDTNGNFTAQVNAGQWEIKPESASTIIHGYISSQSGTNVDAGSTGILFPVSRATALIYGSVKDNLGNPLAGVDVFASDQNYQYETDSYTDQNGDYFAGVLAGTWQAQVDDGNSPGLTNYIFSQAFVNVSGPSGTNLVAGQAVLQNFTARLATNHITGSVQFSGTNLVGLQISAYANIGGLDYQAQADTDSGGNYSMNVANGNWSISPSCNGDDGTLESILGNGNFQCPDNQNVTIANNNATANFTIYPFGTSFLIQPNRNSPTHFSFSIKGEAGVNYTVQVSTNLLSTNWSDLLSTTLTNSYYFISDSDATNSARFYRLKKN